jgi:hypothetical protein
MQTPSAAVVTVLLPLLALPPMPAERAKPDGDDDTLKHYLSKAEAVVVGEVADGLQRIGVDFGPAHPVGVVTFRFRVSESIKGKAAAKETITVAATRALEVGQGVPPRGTRLVLFLKASGESWASADKWFGMHPHSPAFVEHLRRVNNRPEAPAKDR